MQTLKCDMQCAKKQQQGADCSVCSLPLPSSAPLLHGNEAMNGSMSTGRGSRRTMQLWTPTHQTYTFPSHPFGSHLRGLLLKWQRLRQRWAGWIDRV